MTHKGFDTTSNCSGHTEAIKAAGYTFVARYYSHSVWKNLTVPEAHALSRAGIFICAVWESAGDHATFFSFVQGLHDGQAAYSFARQIGQPFTTPIYFAVDSDLPCTPDDNALNGVWAYFRGVNQAINNHPDKYKVGVYGGGHVCRTLKQGALASYTWLAGAMGWQGSREYHEWNILQQGPHTVGGMRVDLDTAADNGGGGFMVS